jgi:DNA-binding transcriptional MocR family regulator
MIELGLQKDYINFLRKTYRDRMVTLSDALRHHIPTLTFTDPLGGYFIWSCLPAGTDTEALLAEANKHQVGFQPGIKFSSTNGLRNYLRFCFAFYGERDLVTGVERLARVIM